MRGVGSLICGTVALVAATTASICQAQDLSPDINAGLVGRIAEIRESIETAQHQFDTLGKQLNDLAQDVQAVKGDFVRLGDGNTVLKKDVRLTAPLEADVAKLGDEIAAAEEARRKAIDEIDGIFDSLVRMRTGNTPAQSLELHAFVRRMLAAATSSLLNGAVVADERAFVAETSQTLRATLAAVEAERRKFEAEVSAGPAQASPDLTASMTALEAQIEQLDTTTATAIDGAEVAALSLSARLAALFPKVETADVGRTVVAIQTAATKLNAVLPTDDAKDGGLKAALLADNAAYGTLVTLEATLNKMALKSAGPVVRILEAKVGDTFAARRAVPSRWCNATAAMAALCDRKPNCKLDAGFEVQLCGFNPAPSADPRHRGVFVRYQCLRGIDANFVGTYPFPPDASGNRTLKLAPKNYVILRGGGAILCSS